MPRVWKVWNDRQGERRAPAQVATEIMVSAARKDHFDVSQIVTAVERYASVQIVVREERLDSDLVGFTERRGNRVVITLCQSCATYRHTLAHELGHVALGHRGCGLSDVEVPPAACEELWRFLEGELNELEDSQEGEAEAFAERVVELWPEEPAAQCRDVLWKAAMTG